MKQFISDVFSFVNELSVSDVIFFASIIVLIILLVSMIYLIKKGNNSEINDNFLIDDGKDDEVLDLNKITKELENNPNPNIDLTAYEEDQEEKAIISYDELLKTSNTVKINYDEEKNDSGISVRKVNLNNLTEKTKEATSDTKINLMSYGKEEAFLETLKKLQNMLS